MRYDIAEYEANQRFGVLTTTPKIIFGSRDFERFAGTGQKVLIQRQSAFDIQKDWKTSVLIHEANANTFVYEAFHGGIREASTADYKIVGLVNVSKDEYDISD